MTSLHAYMFVYIFQLHIFTYMHVCVCLTFCDVICLNRQLSAKFFEFGMPYDLEKVTRATFRTLVAPVNLPKNCIIFVSICMWAIEVDLSHFKVCHESQVVFSGR